MQLSSKHIWLEAQLDRHKDQRNTELSEHLEALGNTRMDQLTEAELLDFLNQTEHGGSDIGRMLIASHRLVASGRRYDLAFVGEWTLFELAGQFLEGSPRVSGILDEEGFLHQLQ